MSRFLKIIGLIVAIPFVLVAIFVLGRFLTCGPDREVVRVAQPIVNQIADYIVKNGIPKSLKSIEGLPFVLKECTHKSYDNEVEEKCYFIADKEKYKLHMSFGASITEFGELKINKEYTLEAVRFTMTNNKIYKNDIYSWAMHHGFLCSAFKQ